MTAEELRRQALAWVQGGEPGRALAAARAAAALAPADAAVLATLATAGIAAGDFPAALAALERAGRLGPVEAAVHLNRGGVLLRLGRAAEAVAAYDAALALAPDQADIRARRERTARAAAAILQRQTAKCLTHGLPSQAEAIARQTLQLCPDLASAHNNLGIVLLETGRLEAAAECFRQALRRRLDYAEVQSNLLYCLNYDPGVDDTALKAAHCAWDAACGPRGGTPRPHANPRQPDRRLRLGYVSPNFNQHPVGWFLVDILHRHDHQRFEVVCYDDGAPRDDVNTKLRAAADHWRETRADRCETLAERIRQDGIDILVDLAGHTAGNRLRVFAAKPAPLQVSWLGWFHTTGLAAMDAAIMDPHTVPAGEERWFSEQVIRLPHTRFAYCPPANAPPVAPPPARRRGHVTFGSFNNLAKVNARVVALWAAVLRAVPDSRLLLKWKTLADEGIRRDITAAFAAHGIDAGRLEMRPKTPFLDMLAEYGDMDIALDPFPFTGGLTSCEALWMGVPVLTLPGRRPVSRQSHAFLANLGLAGAFSATSPDDYVAKAAAWAARPDELAGLRADLRPRLRRSPLCDGAALTRALEAELIALWHRWCERAV